MSLKFWLTFATIGGNMQEWVKHIKKDARKTYCGEWSSGHWLFQDLGHAELTVLQGGRLLPCEKCYTLAGTEYNQTVPKIDIEIKPPEVDGVGPQPGSFVALKVGDMLFSCPVIDVKDYDKKTNLIARIASVLIDYFE